jgi:uncharacterized protein YdeI (YjbR/CyaY-like superfamily)
MGRLDQYERVQVESRAEWRAWLAANHGRDESIWLVTFKKGSGRGSVTQQLNRIVDTARNRLTALEDIAQAAQALYAKLTPEQQPAADPRLANLITMPLATANRGT